MKARDKFRLAGMLIEEFENNVDFGNSLVHAKGQDLLDDILVKLSNIDAPSPTPPAKATPTLNEKSEIVRSFMEFSKIKTIKAFRDAGPGCSLIEAKAAVEETFAAIRSVLGQGCPDFSA